MTDKQKLDAIKAEIHRLVDVRGYDREMANDLLAFMNSLPNEPVSEDFEVEVKNLWKEINTEHNYSIVDSYNMFYGLCMDIADWQKKQLMAKAVSGHVGQTINGMLKALSDETFGDMGFTAGDKVKLIILKEG